MVTFNYTEEFLRQAKRLAKHYCSLADDINALQFELMENPEAGVSLGGGKRKIRLGVKSFIRKYLRTSLFVNGKS